MQLAHALGHKCAGAAEEREALASNADKVWVPDPLLA